MAMLDDSDTDRPLVGRVADVLRGAIRAGQLPPGSDMPRSRLMAAQLGVGLDTVQDALALLKGEGLVVGGRGRVYRVRVKPPVRMLSASRYRREMEALEAGEKIETAFCTDYGIDWDDYTADTTVSRRPCGAYVAGLTSWQPDELVLRRRMVERAAGVAVQIRTSIIPVRLAQPGLDDPAAQPYPGGILAELHAAGLTPNHWREWWPMRQPTSSEARELDIGGDVDVYQWMRWFARSGGIVEISETIVPCHAVVWVQEGDL